MSRVIALSGGIGSGKSTVARMFVELGSALVDADQIVFELQEQGQPLFDEIVAALGTDILADNGALDRGALRKLAFCDPKARAQLEALVWPRVGREIKFRTARAIAHSPPLVVAEVPLLFEWIGSSGLNIKSIGIDATVCVWVPTSTQVERVVARDGCDRSLAVAAVQAQLAIDEKRRLAEYVIDNSGGRQSTREAVDVLNELLTGGSE